MDWTTGIAYISPLHFLVIVIHVNFFDNCNYTCEFSLISKMLVILETAH